MLMSGEPPHIFVEIRRGQKVPLKPRFEKHQRVTNEDLAQLAFSAFLQAPFKAKVGIRQNLKYAPENGLYLPLKS